MNPPTQPNKPIPWLLMGFGLLIPILIISLAFLAAKSDAENQKIYKQQRLEIAKQNAES